MKLKPLALILQCAAGVLALAAGGGVRAADVSPRELEAKVSYCKACHGASGQGYRGATPIPRLAGQPIEYFENQVRAFDERRRENRFMYSVAHALSPQMLAALATHFNKLDPKPIGGAPKESIAAGKKIYDEGGKDIPACASCHGPKAKGDGAFPRLAGQLHDYVFKKLTNWSKERGRDPKKQDTSAIMEPIAHSLTETQVSAVAAYLNYLP